MGFPERGMCMQFVAEFLTTLVKAIVLAGVAVGGIFCGRALRRRKNARQESEHIEQK